jgi:hypothetical protein
MHFLKINWHIKHTLSHKHAAFLQHIEAGKVKTKQGLHFRNFSFVLKHTNQDSSIPDDIPLQKEAGKMALKKKDCP